MSRRDGLPGVLVLGCRMQRPDRWGDVLGWWDELGQPVRRLARRLGLDYCRCAVVGHRWSEHVCERMCCRGLDRGVRAFGGEVRS